MRLLTAPLILLVAINCWAGNITGSIQRPNGQPLANGVVTFSLSQAGVTQAGSITVTSDNVYCGTSSTGTVVGVTDPAAPAVLSANYGAGTLPATQYFVKFTYTAASGESAPSPETTFLMTSNGTLNGNAPLLQPGNATGYKVYIGTTSGGETLQQTVVGFSGWSQSVDLVVGAVAPVSNSTLCNTLIFNDAITPSYTTYLVNLLDSKGKQVAGYPQRYYFSGATLDLSNLAPAGNLYARFPNAIVAQPGGNGLQSIAGPLSLGAYPLTAGAGKFSGPLTAPSLDNTVFVDGGTYPFTATGINQCLTDAASKSGVCDASGVPATTFTSQITVSSSETLIVPSSGGSAWTWSGISNGTSCGIDVEDGGSLIGNGSSNGGSKFTLLTSGTVSMRGLLCGNISGTSSYIRIEPGLLALPQTGASFTKGVVDIEGWFDASVLRNVSISLTQDTTANQTGLYASNLCCSATIERVVSDGGFQSGAIPAHITYNSGEVATDAPILIANSFDHPGSGKNAILFDGTLMGPILDVGQYVEGSNTDTTTPAISVTATKGSVTFVGGKVNMLAVASTAYCLDAPNTSGNSIATYGLACLSQAGGAQNAINDHVTGYTAISNAQGMVSDYSTFGFSSYTLGHPIIATGIRNDGGGFKHLRGTTGCTTGAAVGAACTTTVTWSTAFADANYTAGCSGDLITSGVPVSGGLTAKISASVTFQTVATTAAAAKFTTIECWGVHD